MKIKLGIKRADIEYLCSLCGGVQMGDASGNVEFVCTD